MAGQTIDDKSSDTLVVVSGEGFWTGSSTLPHLHHFLYPPRPLLLFALAESRRAQEPRIRYWRLRRRR